MGEWGERGRDRERGKPETQELEWRDRAEKGDRDRGERGKKTGTRKINRGKRGESQERVVKGERERGERVEVWERQEGYLYQTHFQEQAHRTPWCGQWTGAKLAID